MKARIPLIAGLTATALVATAPALAAPPRLRLDGVGPLRLGMTETQAQATGWISQPTPGCELRSPVPVAYQLAGPNVPAGLVGSAEFVSGKLTEVTVRKGAKTITGVEPGTTTAARMSLAYKRAGYWVTSVYVPLFQARFITASRGGKSIVGISLGASKTKVVRSLSVPTAQACE